MAKDRRELEQALELFRSRIWTSRGRHWRFITEAPARPPRRPVKELFGRI